MILASAILSIALNPLLFGLIGPLAEWLDPLPKPEPEKSLGTEPAAPTPDGRTIIVGFGRVGSVVGSVLEQLRHAGASFVVLGERELALSMADYALACYGKPQDARPSPAALPSEA